MEYLQQHSADQNIARVTESLTNLAAAAAAGGPELSQLFGALVNPANAAYARMGGFGKELDRGWV